MCELYPKNAFTVHFPTSRHTEERVLYYCPLQAIACCHEAAVQILIIMPYFITALETCINSDSLR